MSKAGERLVQSAKEVVDRLGQYVADYSALSDEDLAELTEAERECLALVAGSTLISSSDDL